MFNYFKTNLLSLSVCAATLCGVGLHEVRATTLIAATGVPAAFAVTSAGSIVNLSDQHTHVERISVASNLGEQAPQTQTRYGEGKKYVLQRNVPRGHHPFDNYTLPIV